MRNIYTKETLTIRLIVWYIERRKGEAVSKLREILALLKQSLGVKPAFKKLIDETFEGQPENLQLLVGLVGSVNDFDRAGNALLTALNNQVQKPVADEVEKKSKKTSKQPKRQAPRSAEEIQTEREETDKIRGLVQYLYQTKGVKKNKAIQKALKETYNHEVSLYRINGFVAAMTGVGIHKNRVGKKPSTVKKPRSKRTKKAKTNGNDRFPNSVTKKVKRLLAQGMSAKDIAEKINLGNFSSRNVGQIKANMTKEKNRKSS